MSFRFFVVLLLHAGRCYEGEICDILLPLRCGFVWYHFLPKLKFSDFGQKPWTIVHGLTFGSPKKRFEVRMPSERASQEEQNGANFSFIAPSTVE